MDERKSSPSTSSSYNAIFFLPFLAILLLQDVSNAYNGDERQQDHVAVLGNNTTTANNIQYWRNSSMESPIASYPPYHEPVSFYVMGDTPYKPKESILLIHQLKEIYQDRHLSHIFHVGDLMRMGDCKERRYQHASNILFHSIQRLVSQESQNTTSFSTTTTTTATSSVPILVLPGDNDWLECPNRTLAFRRFKRYFIRENPSIQYIDASHRFSRQAKRVENFVFCKDNILFFGLNMLGRRDTFWKRRYELNIQWFLFHFNNYQHNTTVGGGGIRLIVIVAHSAAARPVYHFIRKFTVDKFIPVLFIHGNGHVYTLTQERENFVKIQLDRGGIAPPLKVQVYGDECHGNSSSTSTSSSNATNANANATAGIISLFSGLVCIDRRLAEP